MPRNIKRRKKFNRNQELKRDNLLYSSDLRFNMRAECRQCGREIVHYKHGYKAGPDTLCQICRRLENIAKRENFSLTQTVSNENSNTLDSRNGVSSHKQMQPSETWNRRIYSTDTPRNSNKQSRPYELSDESVRTVRFKPEKNYTNYTSPANNQTNYSFQPFPDQALNGFFPNSQVYSYEYTNRPSYSNEFSNYGSVKDFSNAPVYSNDFFNNPMYSNEFSNAPAYFNESSNAPFNPNEELAARNSEILPSNQLENSLALSCENSLPNQIPSTSIYPKLKRKRSSPKNKPSKQARYSEHSSTSSPVYITSQFEQLNKNIIDYFIQNNQTEEIFLAKMNLRRKLQSIIEQEFAGCGLFVFGSSMTGFASKTSDVDVCLMFHDLKIARSRVFRILWTLKSLFSRYHFLSNFQVIRAKVPIIKFRDRGSGFEVDLNINNPTGVRNSQLLRSYGRIDGRVRPLILGTKWWARVHDINDAKSGTLSSYSLGLMVIHYLQYGCFPRVIPSLQELQPDKYQPDSDISTLELDEDLPNFKSENHETVGQLFVGFLHYYSRNYDYENSRISVRLGKLLPRVDKLENKEKQLTHWIDIEEPFELTNTARTVNNQKNAAYIKSVFDKSYNTVTEHGCLDLI